ncbi:unnamed protein product [marine sediment metagenome]|uniref:Uncharacterized protein n=1 Tax=marine sediment metagenome TaxID=412755 RepID=X1NJ75_9ZZZZ
MGTHSTRMAKYEWLQRVFNAALEKNKVQDKEKLIANFCIDFGAARRTCLELLKTFEVAGKISIKGKEIIVRKK